MATTRTFDCVLGRSVDRTVLLGFASARVLHGLSFADVLDQDTGRGYQRRLNVQHSLDFRRYVQRDGSTTIPLTFNLRPRPDGAWRVVEDGPRAILEVTDGVRVLSQVDCQHRLGHLTDQDVQLPFMSFVGLDERAEVEIFQVINSKAKGLSPSLLDFHDAKLSSDLWSERPELFVALFLKNEPSSPWYNQLDIGGECTSGLARRASLRTMQKAVKSCLGRLRPAPSARAPETVARAVLDFWSAVATVLPEAWGKPRKHVLTKGIGVYALMDVAADLIDEAGDVALADQRFFASKLAEFACDLDWSTDGPFKGLGGEGGVKAALETIRAARKRRRLRVVGNGR